MLTVLTVLTVPLRAAWDDNDADVFADVFAENGSLLGDDPLQQGEEIRAHRTEQFAGPLRGTRVSDEPVEIRSIADGVAVAVMEGGIVGARVAGSHRRPPGAGDVGGRQAGRRLASVQPAEQPDRRLTGGPYCPPVTSGSSRRAAARRLSRASSGCRWPARTLRRSARANART